MQKKQENNNFDIKRTPIVAVMGHVDHGKTSLLDALRETNVAEKEFGGITQNTRAHQIEYLGNKITFIDTPGHEAFSEMRSRGATVTDVVLLVVAVDDGVQPQTKESIKFAKENNVPVIVAINKIDLPNGKNINKLKQELTSAGLELEEYGGDTLVTEVSALKKQGLNELLESILLVAELQELNVKKLENDIKAEGFVLESYKDDSFGPVSLVICKAGIIEPGFFVVHESSYSKIRVLLTEDKISIPKVEEGDPIFIGGLKSILATGEYIKIVKDEKTAKALSQKVLSGQEQLVESTPEEETEIENDLNLLASLISDAKTEMEIKYLNVILKADTKGTLEVIEQELMNLNDEEVQIKIVDSNVGVVTEKDIQKAKAVKAIIIGFQIDLSKKIENIAIKEKVLVRNYKIIYELVDEMSEAMDSMASPILEKIEVARARVKKIFTLTNKSIIAGCVVEKGTVLKGYKAFVEQGGKDIGEGKIISLKQNKSEVKEVKKGQECGILLDPAVKEISEDDFIVCFRVEKI